MVTVGNSRGLSSVNIHHQWLTNYRIGRTSGNFHLFFARKERENRTRILNCSIGRCSIGNRKFLLFNQRLKSVRRAVENSQTAYTDISLSLPLSPYFPTVSRLVCAFLKQMTARESEREWKHTINITNTEEHVHRLMFDIFPVCAFSSLHKLLDCIRCEALTRTSNQLTNSGWNLTQTLVNTLA